MPSVFLRFSNRSGDLVKGIDRFCDVAASRMDQVVKRTLAGGAVFLNGETPVLTGASVGNWRVSVGSPDDTFHPALLDPARSVAIAANLAAIDRIPSGTKVFYTNPTPWAVHWEYGTRSVREHAPVRRLLSEMPSIVARAVAEARTTDAPEGYFQHVWRGRAAG